MIFVSAQLIYSAHGKHKCLERRSAFTAKRFIHRTHSHNCVSQVPGLRLTELQRAQTFFQDFKLAGCNRMIRGAGQTGTPLEVCGLGGITSLLGEFNPPMGVWKNPWACCYSPAVIKWSPFIVFNWTLICLVLNSHVICSHSYYAYRNTWLVHSKQRLLVMKELCRKCKQIKDIQIMLEWPVVNQQSQRMTAKMIRVDRMLQSWSVAMIVSLWTCYLYQFIIHIVSSLSREFIGCSMYRSFILLANLNHCS
jgi:hypothetical protein